MSTSCIEKFLKMELTLVYKMIGHFPVKSQSQYRNNLNKNKINYIL
jgi:hypothetical protein